MSAGMFAKRLFTYFVIAKPKDVAPTGLQGTYKIKLIFKR